MGINHIEDLSQSKLESFIKCWNENKVVVVEKIDGNSVNFGLDQNDNFYMGTKNIRYENFDQIPDFPYLAFFKVYYNLFCCLPIKTIFDSLEEKHKIKIENKQLFGEAIYHTHVNAIKYDKQIIANGAFVLFKTFQENNKQFWEDLKNELNKFSEIKFFLLKEYDSNNLKITNKDDVKKFLFENYKIKSEFGDDLEGIIIRYQHNQKNELTKIVDREKFSKINKLNWIYYNQLSKFKKDFENGIKNNPENIVNEFHIWNTKVNRLKNFVDIHGKYLLSKPKLFLLNKMIDYYLHKIKNENISKQPKDKIYEIYKKEFYYKNANKSFKTGHSIFYDTKNIKKENLFNLKDKVIKSLSFDKIDNVIVGNINGKKESNYVGDLDIAISKNDLIKFFGLQNRTYKEILHSFCAYASDKNIPYSPNEGLKQFHISFFEHQIDFFIGNVNWMKNILSGAAPESNYKACYRNILLRSIFDAILFADNNGEITKYSLCFKEGLFKKKQKIFLTKYNRREINNIGEKELVLEDCNELAEFLFGKNTSWEDINSFEKLFDCLKSENFIYKDFRHSIMQRMIINFKKSNVEYQIID